MKNSRNLRKALTMVCCAMLLVAISVGATVAYLTSTDEVTNTFTVGKVEITLDETDVDKDGVKDGETRVKANEYRLLPGHLYTKDPTVHVSTASEDCWVFVQVVNEIAAIEAETTIANQITALGWQKLADENVEGDVYYAPAAAGNDLVVFNNFTIKGDVSNETLNTYVGKTVKVTAYAIQKDGFTDAAAAWAAGIKVKTEGGWAEPTTAPETNG